MENKDLENTKSHVGFTAQRSGEETAPVAAPSALVETDAPVTPPCTRCGTTEPPDATGLCPVKTCRCFRVSNTVALVHGARRKFTLSMIERRDAHAAALFAERGGREALDVITQFNVIEFADLTVQYEDVTAYLMDAGTLTQAGRERAAVKHALDISARRERVAAVLQGHASVKACTPTANYEDASLDDLEIKLQQQLDLLRDMRADRERNAAAPPEASEFDPSDTRDAGLAREVTTPTPAPAAEPTCAYGCGTLERCAEIKATNYEAWEVLHGLDPEVIKKKDEAATAVMMRQLKRGTSWDY